MQHFKFPQYQLKWPTIKITKGTWLALFEVLLIAIWAIWVGRGMLEFDVERIPPGTEFPWVIQTNIIWRMLPRCGLCMLWNGSVMGGSPGFAELQGAVLHPAAIITTLLFGLTLGGKMLVLVGLFMGGLAQWWLARVLGLGFVARMWSAGIAVIGGQLAGKMEMGQVVLLLSTASASLVLAPALELVLTGKRRAVIWLGITLALTWLSGQGYLQIAVVFGILPPFLIFLLRDWHKPDALWKPFLLALAISLLLAGIFLVPLLHFWPNIAKDVDPELRMAQPLAYEPLNLVINSMEYYHTEFMGHLPFGYVYIAFIGWIPVLLALLALWLVPNDKRRLLIYFLVSIILLYVISSADLLLPLHKILPVLDSIRNPPLFMGLVVPLVLGLSAWSIDILLKYTWPKIALIKDAGKPLALPLAWIILAIPLLFSFVPVYQFSSQFLGLVDSPIPWDVMRELKTASTQWVLTPWGEYPWIPPLFEQGMKLACSPRAWNWVGHPCPAPYMEVSRDPQASDLPGYVKSFNGISILSSTGSQYAAIQSKSGMLPCSAAALGGNIDVKCKSDAAGMLVVEENYFPGWQVWQDGKPRQFEPGRWLSVQAEAGEHTYQFRYRPWDVWVGLAVTLFGMALAVLVGKGRLLPFLV